MIYEKKICLLYDFQMYFDNNLILVKNWNLGLIRNAGLNVFFTL